LIGLGLILVGTARAWEDVDPGNALAYVFVVGNAGLFAALLALELSMLARTRQRALCGRQRHPRARAMTDHWVATSEVAARRCGAHWPFAARRPSRIRPTGRSRLGRMGGSRRAGRAALVFRARPGTEGEAVAGGMEGDASPLGVPRGAGAHADAVRSMTRRIVSSGGRAPPGASVRRHPAERRPSRALEDRRRRHQAGRLETRASCGTVQLSSALTMAGAAASASTDVGSRAAPASPLRSASVSSVSVPTESPAPGRGAGESLDDARNGVRHGAPGGVQPVRDAIHDGFGRRVPPLSFSSRRGPMNR
jgi:hypothetical protein